MVQLIDDIPFYLPTRCKISIPLLVQLIAESFVLKIPIFKFQFLYGTINSQL